MAAEAVWLLLCAGMRVGGLSGDGCGCDCGCGCIMLNVEDSRLLLSSWVGRTP